MNAHEEPHGAHPDIRRNTRFGLTAAGVSASAETTDLTDIPFESLNSMQVSTASRFTQSVREAPSAVQVIHREDIRRHGWRTLGEALASLPGLFTVTDGAYDFAGTRGFLVPGDYNTRFLLLLDGFRLNDNIYQQALLGEEFPLDMALIERIEYVPDRLLGLRRQRHFRRHPRHYPPQCRTAPASLSAVAADDRRLQGSLTVNRRLPSGASVLAAVNTVSRGSRDRRYDTGSGGLITANGQTSPDGVARDREALSAKRLMLRYEDDGLTLALRHGERRVEPSSALYGSVFNEPSQYVEDLYQSLSGQYVRALTGTLNLESRLEVARSTYRSDSPYLDSGALYMNHDRSEGRWASADIRLLHTGLAGHKLISGVEVRRDTRARQQNHDRDAAVNPPVDISSPAQRSGVYFQDEWTISRQWRLNAGLRYDHLDDADPVTSPRLGLIWLATPARTLKLLAGKAYRSPNAYERDYGNGINYLANAALKPETIRTLEAVLEEDFSPTRRLSLSVYRYRLEDLISQQVLAGGSLQYLNQPGVRAAGLEVGWQSTHDGGLVLNLGATLSRTEDDTGRTLHTSPQTLIKARAALPLPGDRWQVALEGHYTGGSDYTWQGTQQSLKARALLNLNLLTRRPLHGLDLNLRILNLLDRDYALPASEEIAAPSIPGDGLTVEAGVRHAF